MIEIDLRSLDTAAIAQQCADDTQRFLRRLSGVGTACFELFRRAILDREVQARLAITDIYTPVVTNWVARGAPQLDDAERDFLVSEETDRFWVNYTAEKFKRAVQLAQVLAYWEICVKRAARKLELKRSRETLVDPHDQANQMVAPDRPIPDEVDERLRQQRFWDIVLTHCKDEVDRVLARQIIVECTRPSEIYVQLPQHFTSIDDVYRRTRNLMDRWRRDERLRQLWEDSK